MRRTRIVGVDLGSIVPLVAITNLSGYITFVR